MIGPTGRAIRSLLLLLLLCSPSTSFSQLNTLTGWFNDDPQAMSSWSRHNLSSVPKGLDVRLRYLDLSKNVIRSINSQDLGLPSLKTLDLSYNKLETIYVGAFRDMAQLQELNLARNMLSHNVNKNSQALTSLNRLRRLDISVNGLDDNAAELCLHNKSVLEHLNLTGNILMRLAPKQFMETRNLRHIHIENNLITVIEVGTFEPLKKLETLNLAKNNLIYICDFKLHQVKHLNLSRNSIEFFVTHEDGQPYSLETLDLSYNNMIYFPIVPKTNRLRYLHLQNNKVGAMEVATADDEKLNDAVENNNVYSNWRLMPLIYMDLSSNHFSYFPAEILSQLTSLSTLNFSNNCLTDLSYNTTKYGGGHVGDYHQPSWIFPSLRFLNLKNNGLQQLSRSFLKALPSIETLNLRENSVRPCGPSDELGTSEIWREDVSSSCVSFWNIKSLRHLDLQDNGIKTIFQNTFQKTPLVSLNLASNIDMNFARDALEGLQSSLQSLSISGNNMMTSDLSLPCLEALRQLNMSGNDIDVLPTVIGCSPLAELDVRNNSLTSINVSMLDRLSLHLDMIYVSGNPFKCCDSKWLTALNKASVDIPDLDRAMCTISRSNGMQETDYLRNHSRHCSQKHSPKIPELNLWQIIIFILFMLTVLITVQISIVYLKKVYCDTGSLIV
ncbi:transforming growth factor beta activator LRRC32-like [Esox lucius]|uniref:transforming growth factor beta activator LRRC32-like n=1 Tax=Esox lucius TaxID=8010 RepID=UPI000577B0E5|nr:transforming growth factor beta activator LRRC32-like [Esox lucius]